MHRFKLPVFEIGVGCNAYREKVFRSVALASEITGEAALMKTSAQFRYVINLFSR